MSEIITDKLTGRGVAKTVTVTVGASATQSLEQGLAKAYAVTGYSSGTPQTTDLFNVSSLSDTNTGRMGVNFTSAFDSVNYTKIGAAGVNESANYYCVVHEDAANSSSASVAQIIFVSHNNAADDPTKAHLIFQGDLA